ncbi:peptidylprolyl isomerase [Corticibacter populi]|uniref:peptidylprolyl isomerase n=1 Tax=Corticibacter populi TaxID=1550736 RepID=A0A3M6QPR9_9BURK|nr:FKBP-type peptidyl-prolyl cis-trans isomerase [Corticibacter populi]RMX04781.1 peptidylprolyl isomerase [Corticibacter populi]RZS33807.1 FKBP-type peptidyl-prolyl cis-trans isomerase SlyD [Corticibacter populi]
MSPSSSTVQPDTVVTIRYRLDDAQGRPMQSKADEVAYLHGGHGNLLPKIEAALEGQATGFATTVDLPPEEGFGVRDESLVKTIPKSELPPGTKVGGQLRGPGPDGSEHLFHVTKIKGTEVLLDGNHPLAGQHVRFVVRILGVRAATPEEVAHGHAHGEHGHHH